MGLVRLWRGTLPLDTAFWQYAVVGGVVVNLVTTFLFMLFMAAGNGFAAVVMGYGVSLPYNLLALVGVWRSAAREPGGRADIYRLVTLVGMVVLSVT